MNSEYVRENHVVDRYLLGRLSDEEAAAFEEYYMDNPALVRELEIARELHTGLRDTPELLVQDAGASGVSPWWRTAAIAASLLLGLTLVMQFVSSGGLTANRVASIDGTGSPVALLGRYTLVSTRGASSAQALDLPAEGPIALSLEVGAHGYPDYRVRIDEDSERTWSVDGTGVNRDGIIDLVLDASLLAGERHDIVIEGKAGERWVPVADFATIPAGD